MPRVSYQRHDGVSVEVDAPAGMSARDVALAHGIAGIVGECGGGNSRNASSTWT